MSDIKRVELTSLASTNNSSVTQKKENSKKTVRICVLLEESNEDTCPEYNYKDELAAAKSKRVNNNNKDSKIPADPFGDENDDDDVKRIARQMEEKYGGGGGAGAGNPNKKKRKMKKDDYADIGMGYDESDSFIDNTDGYDEIIPQNVTTLHGGFYINCGALEFKTDDEVSSEGSSSSSSSSDDDEKGGDVATAKPKRKRVIESDSEDSDGTEKDKDKQKDKEHTKNHSEKKIKLYNGTNNIQHIKKKKFATSSPLQIKKKKVVVVGVQKKTVKEILKEKRKDLNMTVLSETFVVEDNNTVKEKPNVVVDESKKVQPVSSSISETIESVVKAVNKETANNDNSIIEKKVEEPSTNNSSLTLIPMERLISNEKVSNSVSITPSLPQNLPSDVTDIVNTIKIAAVDSVKRKSTFFTEKVNELFLSLEKKCKCLGKPSKIRIYEYMASYAECKKDVLIHHAKSLILEDEAKKLTVFKSRLKNEITQIMPKLLISYEEDCQQVIQKRLAQDNTDKDGKNFKQPKRRFLWNENAKKLLKDIINIKRRCINLEGHPRENRENLILAYLKSDIQPLWPDGWMSMTHLTKVCNSFAENSDPNKKKPNIVKETVVKDLSKNANNNVSSSSSTVTNSMRPMSSNSNERVSEPKNETPKVINLVSNSNGIPVPLLKKEDTSITIVKQDGLITAPPQHSQKDEGLTIVPQFRKEESISKLVEDSHKSAVHKVNNLSQDAVKSFVAKDYSNNFFQDILSMCSSKQPPDVVKQSTEVKKDRTNVIPVEPHSYKSSSNNLEIIKLRNEGDDIQKVMEDLKVLQKMSSPAKSDSISSSPVSVISYNKNFSPKSNNISTSLDNQIILDDSIPSFQEEFQKQLLSSIGHVSSGISKSHRNS